VHLQSRVKKVLRVQQPDDFWTTYHRILGGEQLHPEIALSDKDLGIVKVHHAALGGPVVSPSHVCQTWAEMNLHRAFMYHAWLADQVEDADRWSLAPIMSPGVKHLTIDAAVLLELLKTLHIQPRGVIPRRELWSLYVDVPHRGSGWTFNGSVVTDGVSASFSFEKPIAGHAKDAPPAQTQLREGDVVVGVDPGRSCLATCATLGKHGRSWKLSRTRYLHATLRKAQERQTVRLDDKMRETATDSERAAMDATCMSSKKAADFLPYCRVAMSGCCRLYMYRNRKTVARRMKMRVHAEKCRVVDGFFSKVEQEAKACAPATSPDRRVLFAYGAAKVAPTGRGEAPVCPDWAAKRCAKAHATCFVDEFRSTRMCCACHQDTQAVRVDGQQFPLRGLRRCPACVKYLSRDVNAARNIARCFVEECTSGSRPAAFRRGGAALIAQASHVVDAWTLLQEWGVKNARGSDASVPPLGRSREPTHARRAGPGDRTLSVTAIKVSPP
jgi:hypothetical protein